jgi:hypothetical protein
MQVDTTNQPNNFCLVVSQTSLAVGVAAAFLSGIGQPRRLQEFGLRKQNHKRIEPTPRFN